MQNSMSDPALTPCRVPDPSHSFLVNRSQSSQLSRVSKTRSDVAPEACKASNTGMTSPKRTWVYANPLACIQPDAAARNLRKVIDKRSAVKEDRNWADYNFPKHRPSGTFCACVVPLVSDEAVTPFNRIIGREVAPQEYIISFSKTKGGISYTVGSRCGGRGFFVHPPGRGRHWPTLQVIEDRSEAARSRRQRHLQQRMERAQEMSRRRRPASPAPIVPQEMLQPVPDTAARAAYQDFAEVPLWEDPDDVSDKRSRKHKKLKQKKSDKALWQRITNFFGGKNVASCSLQLSDIDVLRSQIVEVHKVPETMSLPGINLTKSPLSRKLSPKGRSRSLKDRAQPKRKKSNLQLS